MATFEEICKEDKSYECDKCKSIFGAKEIVLVDAPTNITILTPLAPMIFIDKDGVIKSGGTGAKEGDRMLACPKCKELHMYGLTPVQAGGKNHG